MTRVYASERAKYGNLTGQIIIWPVQVNPDINSNDNKDKLPSGYLRCDGTVYNVVDYPQLAAICGVGTSGKFVRRDLDGEPLQTLTDNQFVVPDLGSKYPKPVDGPDAGQYKSIRVENQAGNEISRSGIGIEATATLGTSIQLTYSGTFIVPSQTIELKGKPSWTVGTQAGKVTDTESVPDSGLHGHAHFFQGVRTRLRAVNEIDAAAPSNLQDPQAVGQVAFWNASTVPIDDWLDETKASGASNFPGNNQPPCKAMASNSYARGYEFYFGAFAGTFDPTTYSNGCYNGGAILEDQWRYFCLLKDDWNNYPISQGAYQLNGLQPKSDSGTAIPLTGLCVPDDTNSSITTSQDVNATYDNGTAPVDWRDISLVDVVPLNGNLNSDTSRIYASLFNEFSESTELDQEGDPTNHFHKVTIEKGDHNFALKTDPLEISPDALKTVLNLSVDQSASVDNVSAPFIVLEYLIKI